MAHRKHKNKNSALRPEAKFESEPYGYGPLKRSYEQERNKNSNQRSAQSGKAISRHDENFRLKDIDPRDTLGLPEDKPRAKQALAMGIEVLAELQDMLYAQDNWAVLLVFQAMDAAGKDGAIKHVMSGVNPQGCQVFSFKAPTSHDLDHDYLWRCIKCLPERGRIGIFNRSYYEETLVVRFIKNVAQAKNPTRGDHQRYLGETFPGYPWVRALFHTEWRGHL